MVRRFRTAIQRFLICGALVAAAGACASSKPDLPKPVTGGVRFTLSAPEAKKVVVVGSFNGWASGATPMKQAGASGLWVADAPLDSGEHTFMYLVDDKDWVVPPQADDFVTDGFGQINGVVVVR